MFLKAVFSLIVAAGLLPLAFAQGSTTPTQPQDPTAQTPTTQAPGQSPATTQPLPEPSAKQPPDESPTEARSTSTSGLHSKARPFMGRVVHDTSGYVLKAGDLEYKLDDQDRAREFKNRNVKVMGTLDKPTNTIHIGTIEASPSM
jgi:hypothetical protein